VIGDGRGGSEDRRHRLVLDLSLMEKLLAKHGSLKVALSSVEGVEVVDDAKRALGWVTLMGAAFPGAFGIGAFHSRGSRGFRQFAVVHRNTQRGVRVQLQGAAFDEFIVGCDNPEAAVTVLGLGAHSRETV
jgi:hypothetical protein